MSARLRISRSASASRSVHVNTSKLSLKESFAKLHRPATKKCGSFSVVTKSAHGTQRTTVFGLFDHLVLSGADRPIADGPSAGGLKVPWGGHHNSPLPETSDQRPQDQRTALRGNDQWTEAEIVHGHEECMHLLQSVAANAEILAPIKSADCGLPAPIRLKSLGSSSAVVFDPPVEVNCRMMAALYRWDKTALQPAARNKLGSPVVRILGASGYACRNVYNRPDGNLSQHAFANAVDIAAFELKDGRSITVRKGWGPTARDLKAQAKEKSEQAKMAASLPCFVLAGALRGPVFCPSGRRSKSRNRSP